DPRTGHITYLNEDATNYAVGRFPLTLEAVHVEDRHQLQTLQQQLTHLDARSTVDFRVNPIRGGADPGVDRAAVREATSAGRVCAADQESDSGWRWVRARLRVSRCDADGLPVEITGVCTDVTEAIQ